MLDKSIRSYVYEGTVIVASILIAFAVDASWENYQESTIEKRILMELFDEFNLANSRITASLTEIENVIAASLELLEYMGPEASDLSEDAIVEFIGRIMNLNTIEVPSSVLDSVIATGQFRLISNNAIKKALSEWPALVSDVRENHEWHRLEADEVLAPYFAEYISLPTYINGQFESRPTLFLRDSTALLQDPVFEGRMVWRINRQQATLTESKILLSAAEELIAMIEEEIS